MNVSHNIDSQNNGILTVEIEQNDFAVKVEKALLDYRKRANIPGFRIGMAPMGMIKKQYEASVRTDEVNKLLQDGLFNYLESEKLEILGQPLPVPNTVDFSNSKFQVEFEIGVAPQFDLDISDKTKLTYNQIKVDQSTIDEEMSNLQNRFGKMSEVEIVGDQDVLFGDFIEVDKRGNTLENGLVKEGRLGVKSISDRRLKKSALLLKKGDTISFSASKSFEDDFDLLQLLGLSEDEKGATIGLFKLNLKTIYHVEPATIDKDLFDKVFGQDAINTKAEFLSRIQEDIEGLYKRDCDIHFFNTVTDHLMKTKMNLPKNFMKKWISQQGETPPTIAEIDEQWPQTEKAMRWQLIEGKLQREHNLHVDKEELVAFAVKMVKSRMSQYGQMMDDQEVEKLALNVLENREQAEQLSEQLLQDKMLEFFKESFSLKLVDITYANFLKLVKKAKK
ncbi:MAG: trigger factor [Schleiferiaceae bacterium]|nr:trigger factor [Schleiferiaceae bacterium]